MTIDIEKHAEAILRECPMPSAVINNARRHNETLLNQVPDPHRRAILTACTALFDAGAKAGLDAAVDHLMPKNAESDWSEYARICAGEADDIRAITPATLRGVSHD